MTIRTLITCIFILLVTNVLAQRITREQYVETYKQTAIGEMLKTGIPASITLAQGILESDCGNSELAVNGNNHFGIKCHDWKGDTIHHHDDRASECFRKYKKAEESYADHSAFLLSYKRYDFLFKLDRTDYKGWANGLRKAGYATDPSYAERLIKIIEDLNLNQYDVQTAAAEPEEVQEAEPEVVRRDEVTPVVTRRTDSDFKINPFHEHVVLYNNGVKYVEVAAGDTFDKIASEFYLMTSELLSFNDLAAGADISKIRYLYVASKRNRAHRDCPTHTVKNGETAWQIAHTYGIKLKKLRKFNSLAPGQEPKVGETLSLRKKR